MKFEEERTRVSLGGSTEINLCDYHLSLRPEAVPKFKTKLPCKFCKGEYRDYQTTQLIIN